MQSVSSLILLALIVTITYLNSFGGVFQFDDYNVIVDNPVVHNWSAWFDDLLYGIRPILKFTYVINWTSGIGLFGFHLLNLVIHILNTILIYFLSMKFIGSIANITASAIRKSAILTALLWALHPVQTESVTYISGRSSSLMAMFYLLSLLSYIHYSKPYTPGGIREDKDVIASNPKGEILPPNHRGQNDRQRTRFYLASLLFFIMAVLTKETAVTLPLTLFLWEVTIHKQKGFLMPVLKKQCLYYIILGFIIIAFIVHPNYGGLLEYSFDIRSVKDNLLSQINGISYLISRLFMLHRLNIDPDLPVISEWTSLVVAEAVFLSALVLAGVVCIRKRPWVGFGILWFSIHLLSTNSFVPRLDMANERQLYLPLYGIFLALSVEVIRFQNVKYQRQQYVQVAVITLCVILGSFTAARNYIYRSEIALWEDTALKSSQKARVYNNLGYAYAIAGRYKEAKQSYLRAIALKPDYQLPLKNLSTILEEGKLN